jgi:thymidylate synthase
MKRSTPDDYAPPNVTPSPKRTKKEVSDESSINDPLPSARRNIFDHLNAARPRHEPKERSTESSVFPSQGEDDDSIVCSTQEPTYTQDNSFDVDTSTSKRFGMLVDVHDAIASISVERSTFVLGRGKGCDLVLDNPLVSHIHCTLGFESDGTATLVAGKSCWVAYKDKWEEVLPNKMATLVSDQRFRLAPPGRVAGANSPKLEFRIYIAFQHHVSPCVRVGTNSFDHQYISLLRAIKHEGEEQNNKKGSNITLRRPFTFVVPLDDEEDRNLLPLTTLRNVYNGRGALLEAIWYLRGEDHIRFLQENKCTFWDKQCRKEDGWLGLNYGLLTNFPAGSSNGQQSSSVNQLEEKVLSRLCKSGEKSRNMVCTLIKPEEPTEQVACTSSIQFSVSMNENEEEALDLTVNQRSSDVILGLPHDVVVWSIILHLVRREVRIRTCGKRKLAAGNLIFSIAGGGAHVYCANSENSVELLSREPKEGTNPFLKIREEAKNKDDMLLFSLVNNFKAEDYKVCGYSDFHKAIRIKQVV